MAPPQREHSFKSRSIFHRSHYKSNNKWEQTMTTTASRKENLTALFVNLLWECKSSECILVEKPKEKFYMIVRLKLVMLSLPGLLFITYRTFSWVCMSVDITDKHWQLSTDSYAHRAEWYQNLFFFIVRTISKPNTAPTHTEYHEKLTQSNSRSLILVLISIVLYFYKT